MVSNNELKLLKNLSKKRFREKHRLFIVEGLKMLEEALSSGWIIRKVFASNEEWDTMKSMAGDVPSEEITLEDLMQVTSQVNPSGIVALVEIPSQDLTQSAGPVLVLDGIRDPGNLGTIIRSADWFGIRHIWCSEDCVDSFNPKVVQSTMGALFRTSIQYLNIPEALESWNREKTFRIGGAVLGGTTLEAGKPLEIDALIIGSESHGIREGVLAHCDEQISIPGKGGSESLNASVAASILLYHWTSLRS